MQNFREGCSITMSKVLLEKWAKITLYEARKVEVETDTHLHTVKKEHNYRILRGHLLPLFYGGGIQKNQGCHFIVYQWEYYQKQYNNKGFHHHLMLMPRFFLLSSKEYNKGTNIYTFIHDHFFDCLQAIFALSYRFANAEKNVFSKWFEKNCCTSGRSHKMHIW